MKKHVSRRAGRTWSASPGCSAVAAGAGSPLDSGPDAPQTCCLVAACAARPVIPPSLRAGERVERAGKRVRCACRTRQYGLGPVSAKQPRGTHVGRPFSRVSQRFTHSPCTGETLDAGASCGQGRGQTGDTCLSTLGSLPVSSRSSTRLNAAFGDGNHAVDDILVEQARRDKVAQLERAPVGSCLTGHLTRQTSSRAAQTTRRSGALALLSARRATCERDAVPARAVSHWGVANRCFSHCKLSSHFGLGEVVGNPGLTTALPPPLPNTRVPWLTAPRRHHHP
jgi:hypothetical protein